MPFPLVYLLTVSLGTVMKPNQLVQFSGIPILRSLMLQIHPEDAFGKQMLMNLEVCVSEHLCFVHQCCICLQPSHVLSHSEHNICYQPVLAHGDHLLYN